MTIFNHLNSELEDLVDRVCQGDRQAAEVLAERAWLIAVRTASGMLHDDHLARDVAQETSIQALKVTPKLRKASGFDGLAHRISVRITMREVRRRSSQITREVELNGVSSRDEMYLVRSDDDPASKIDDELEHLIYQLPTRQQAALTLRYVHELTDEEISQALKCRPSTVRSLLRRARSTLQEKIELENSQELKEANR